MQSCCKYFEEKQVFRIDHYLGKETVQNLMVMRFANSIFEPIWNYKYIDHVQITVSETVSADDRAGYYDKSGATRDMIQNHIFQLMALVAMEPPAALDATSIRDEKVKVYKSVRQMDARTGRLPTPSAANTVPANSKTNPAMKADRRLSQGPRRRAGLAAPKRSPPSSSSSTIGDGAACPSTSAPANACRRSSAKSSSASVRRR